MSIANESTLIAYLKKLTEECHANVICKRMLSIFFKCLLASNKTYSNPNSRFSLRISSFSLSSLSSFSTSSNFFSLKEIICFSFSRSSITIGVEV